MFKTKFLIFPLRDSYATLPLSLLMRNPLFQNLPQHFEGIHSIFLTYQFCPLVPPSKYNHNLVTSFKSTITTCLCSLKIHMLKS